MLQFKGPQRVGHDLVSEQHQQFLNDLRHSKWLDIQGLLSPAWCLFHTTTAPCIMIYMCIYSLCTTTCAPGLPRLHSVKKKSACRCRKCRRHRFDPWVGKISLNRKWQPAPVLLPEKCMDRGSWHATVHVVTESQLNA